MQKLFINNTLICSLHEKDSIYLLPHTMSNNYVIPSPTIPSTVAYSIPDEEETDFSVDLLIMIQVS